MATLSVRAPGSTNDAATAPGAGKKNLVNNQDKYMLSGALGGAASGAEVAGPAGAVVGFIAGSYAGIVKGKAADAAANKAVLIQEAQGGSPIAILQAQKSLTKDELKAAGISIAGQGQIIAGGGVNAGKGLQAVTANATPELKATVTMNNIANIQAGTADPRGSGIINQIPIATILPVLKPPLSMASGNTGIVGPLPKGADENKNQVIDLSALLGAATKVVSPGTGVGQANVTTGGNVSVPQTQAGNGIWSSLLNLASNVIVSTVKPGQAQQTVPTVQPTVAANLQGLQNLLPGLGGGVSVTGGGQIGNPVTQNTTSQTASSLNQYLPLAIILAGLFFAYKFFFGSRKRR